MPSRPTAPHHLVLYKHDSVCCSQSPFGKGLERRRGSFCPYDVGHTVSSRIQASKRRKDKGSKKNEWTDPIFENVRAVNAEADSDPKTVRISVDTKAVVSIGEYSRKGKSRQMKALAASDHDMQPKEKLVPGGILETTTGKAFLFFSGSCKTSDFLVDGIELWWNHRKKELDNVKRVVINMDNGPECSGRRGRFLQRIAEFSEMAGLEIRLVYYPPYHSKYNYIEHYWGGLERSWNGYLLDSVETVLRRAGSFVWKSMRATVMHIEKTYEKGIKLNKKEKMDLENRLYRSKNLPWWDITIHPLTVN
jgi:transposase